MSKAPDISLCCSSDDRRFWRGDNGGAIYYTVAPNALWAMLAILQAEHRCGCTDDMTELSVREVDDNFAATKRIRDDDKPTAVLRDLSLLDVVCSEWP